MIQLNIGTYRTIVLATLMGLMSCVEEVSFETQELENALVIEATITNELKPQVIRLSRTYAFEDSQATAETGARVWIESDLGNIAFEESSEAGVYVSNVAFAAENNCDYKMLIDTQDGKSYSSDAVQLALPVAIENVYAVRETNDFGADGISIYVDSFDPLGLADYYRYEYVETYKIVAPLWNATSMTVIDGTCDVVLGEREQEERVCFNTVASTDINLVNSSGLSESRVQRHLVRFLNADNYIISHRYSILLRQYVHSREAYAYFNLLRDLSESDNLFSQNQPGFFDGNIRAVDNSEEKVVGFFEVASVSERRLYFNYEDFFPNERLPPYPSGCTEIAPEQFTPAGICGALVSGILNNEIRFMRENDMVNDIFPGPYIVVARACGDCTALGTNITPDFWVD